MAATVPPDWHLRTRLNVRQLALLVALDDLRSLRRAAGEIAVTQPAATRLLRDVETALGVQLFERTPRGMQPTIYGEALIRYARGILTDLSEARDELAAIASGAKGRLRVGSVTGAVPGLLVPALAAVRRNRPALRSYVLVNTTEVQIAALRQGTLDVAIGPLPPHEEGTSLVIEALGDEPLCVVARAGHALARRRQVAPAALADATWIVPPPDTALRQNVDALFAEAGMRPPADLIETVSIVATLALVQSIDALSVLPAGLAAYYEERGQLARLAVAMPTQGSRYELIYRDDRRLAPAAEDFVAIVRAVARDEHAPPVSRRPGRAGGSPRR